MVGVPEWQDWYQPDQWLHPSRALGAFIRQRVKVYPGTVAAVTPPEGMAVCESCGCTFDPTALGVGADTVDEFLYCPTCTVATAPDSSEEGE